MRETWVLPLGLLPGEFHGQRSLTGYSPSSCKVSNTTEQLFSFTLIALPHDSPFRASPGLLPLLPPPKLRPPLLVWAFRSHQCLPSLCPFPCAPAPCYSQLTRRDHPGPGVIERILTDVALLQH